MNIYFSEDALPDYIWFANHRKTIAERIVRLIRSIKINPVSGIGKPKPLKHKLSGLWSRRIDNQNRLIYRIIDQNTVEIVGCKGHYE